MQIPRGTHCPLLNTECIQHRCAWWVKLRGKHPQENREIDEYDCAVFWLPVLLIETTQAVHGAQAATESFRNEMVQGPVNVLFEGVRKKLLSTVTPDRVTRGGDP